MIYPKIWWGLVTIKLKCLESIWGVMLRFFHVKMNYNC